MFQAQSPNHKVNEMEKLFPFMPEPCWVRPRWPQRCHGSPKLACPHFYSTGSALWFQQPAMLSPTLPLLEGCLFVTHRLIACIRKSTFPRGLRTPSPYACEVLTCYSTCPVLSGILVLSGLISDLISYNLRGTIQGLRRLRIMSLRSASSKEWNHFTNTALF